MASQRSLSRRRVALGLAGALIGLFLLPPSWGAHGVDAQPCGNPGPGPGIDHVIVVMLENQSYGNVIGNATDAPYINNTLTTQCGYATKMFGATHWSAANYLAITAGQYPPESVSGCGYVAACDTANDNIFHQTQVNGLTWKAYQESMPSACYKSSTALYSLGHNPVPFYTDLNTTCNKYDVPVGDLTAQSGVFWSDLQNRTLPSYSFVTPNDVHNGHDDGSGLPAIDTFLSQFVPLVEQSNSYHDGDTALFITFDEGAGGTKGQDCTNQTKDMAGTQESCHIPFFVVSPFTPAGAVGGFFDHYSMTRTTEELLRLPFLAGAATAPSLSTAFHLVPTVHEYVTNRGFETGTEAGWGGVYTANSMTAPTQATAFGGTWSLAVSSTVTDATSTVGVKSKPAVITNATAGTQLTGSVYVKASVPGITVNQIVWEKAPDGTNVAYQALTLALADTEWHQIKAASPYTVHTDGDTIMFTVYSKNLPAGGAFYADNFSLTSLT